MSRVQAIVDRARATLADPNQQRWPDSRLIDLIDEAQKDIAIHTRLFKNEADIYPISKYVQLPDDVYILTRAHNGDRMVELLTYNEMDNISHQQSTSNDSENLSLVRDFDSFRLDSWETATGDDLEALIYDRSNLDTVRVYPVPTFSGTVESSFGVAIPEEPTAGIYGVINQGFGVTVGVTDNPPVHIWYVCYPPAVIDASSKLSVSTMWDTALKHYVVAHAFDDDYDTKFAEKSAKALQLYERELLQLMDTSAHSGVKTSKKRAAYVGAF